ncbi:hypothetical protein EYF80_036244 [Liparis tanakae]|uniref:Uncharacterized protein n=1 Tax=Liparis tanakae TaxID=230148 RepID=A0A4Z2GL78_9TELE|nr:hypothetical protein EYF80_036244 [Liparis tanakae]
MCGVAVGSPWQRQGDETEHVRPSLRGANTPAPQPPACGPAPCCASCYTDPAPSSASSTLNKNQLNYGADAFSGHLHFVINSTSRRDEQTDSIKPKLAPWFPVQSPTMFEGILNKKEMLEEL